ncbi:MAG TPA: amidohydrolase family protein, partial [Terriglobales bacterium]|nr:amidohydrolase family protein [Terriglobales bacterium]
FSPYPIWLDPDKQLFAAGSEWSTVIREGWESVWPTLLKAQESAQAERNTRLAKELAKKPAGRLVFRHANLFDSETATIKPGMTVVINGNRIEAVEADNALKNIPAGAQVIDATGKTLIPGLWDMHVHLGEDDGMLDIAAGVTTVRDLANDIDKLMAMRKSFDSGEAIGPRVIMAGFIDGPGPYQGPTKILASTPEQARQFVDRYKMLGYEQIKIYSSVNPELVPVIIDEAHKNGLRVSGHIPAFMSAQQAVEEGYNEIQHINFIFLNFWFDRVKDTRTPARFTEVAQHAAELDLKSQPVQNFIALLKERHVDIDPTVGIFEGMFLARPGSVDPQFAEVADRMPPQVRRGFLGGGLPVPEGMDQRYRDSAQALLNMVNLLYTSGIPIDAGTDTLAGFALHSELEYFVKAGIPAPQVLQIATLGAARIMKHDGQSGSITPGKLADVVLIDGNPATRISDIRRVKTVVKDGVVYDSTAVYRAMGVAPY